MSELMNNNGNGEVNPDIVAGIKEVGTDPSESELIPAHDPFVITEPTLLKTVIDDYIVWSIDRFDGDKHATAEALGITKRTILNRMKN